MLAIENLAFRHEGGEVTYRFELSIRPGEIVGLTGPSGSGKSTLLDLIAGFLTPLSGDIVLDGRSILGQAPEERPVSILFQSDNLFDHLTAGANVALGVSRRARADSPQVEKALADMELEGLAKRRAANLSGGQRQRVALARTLLRNKPVLLLDEPFTGLDEETAGAIRKIVREIVAGQGWHAILVSHDKDDIAALAQQHYRLENGRSHKV